MRRGMYRVRGIDGLPNDVRVDDDGITVPLEEAAYIARGYLPHVTDLPWQGDYVALQALPETPKLLSGRASVGGWRRAGSG